MGRIFLRLGRGLPLGLSALIFVVVARGPARADEGASSNEVASESSASVVVEVEPIVEDDAEPAPEPMHDADDVPPIVAALRAEPRPERGPLLLTLELDFQKAIAETQRDLYGPGLSLGFALEYAINHWLLVGGRLRAGFLFDAPPGVNASSDPGYGTQLFVMPSVRFRPAARASERARGLGFFVDLAVGGGIDNGRGVAAFELGLGYMLEAHEYDVGPVVRYLHAIHPNRSDLGMLVFGVQVSFRDARTPEQVDEPVMTWTPTARARDTDRDGIPDAQDACVREAEDLDGFEDEDGCPDYDNDGDGILDRDDACPNEAEDFDGFEDEDGCPDPDNDGDGIFDDADSCPLEAEVVNGFEDEDGCPDVGLVALVEGRFVLEDAQLFTGSQARFAGRAGQALDAIVAIWQRHPEWVSIRIESHFEARGNAARNQRTTAQRAEAIRAALIDRGMPESLLVAEGMGAGSPREGGASRTSRRHRRVEITIVTPQ